MNDLQNIYYWSPCLTRVGTYRSTINSSISLAKYSKKFYKVKIINSCGEWDDEIDFLKKNNVDVINLGPKYFKFLPKTGFVKTRLSYILIILISFLFLLNLIIRRKPDFLVIHLITSLPLILLKIFNFKTKFILRVSGYPRMSFFRKFLWKSISKKIFKVTCPSNDSLKALLEENIFSFSKLFFLPDPIINIQKFNKKQIISLNSKERDKVKKKYFISVGRLTRQKNFDYLIDEFYEFSQKVLNINLLIFGDGEEKDKLNKKIAEYNLTDRVYLMGYSENIYFYMKNAYAFILSSLWEDPGFVLIEAAMNNLFIISSNCKNGPEEFLENGEGGLLFNSNEKNALSKSLHNFVEKKDGIKKKKIKAKKNCLKYSLLRHNNIFLNILTN